MSIAQDFPQRFLDSLPTTFSDLLLDEEKVLQVEQVSFPETFSHRFFAPESEAVQEPNMQWIVATDSFSFIEQDIPLNTDRAANDAGVELLHPETGWEAPSKFGFFHWLGSLVPAFQPPSLHPTR